MQNELITIDEAGIDSSDKAGKKAHVYKTRTTKKSCLTSKEIEREREKARRSDYDSLRNVHLDMESSRSLLSSFQRRLEKEKNEKEKPEWKTIIESLTYLVMIIAWR